MKLRADVFIVGAVVVAAVLAWLALKEEPAAAPASVPTTTGNSTAAPSELSAPLPGSGTAANSGQPPAEGTKATPISSRPPPPTPAPLPQIMAPAPSAPAKTAFTVEHATPEDIEAATRDMDKVSLMIRDFRTRLKENPVGTNAEIMRALMGENAKGARLGPLDGQQINGKGELVDRWGTPYFFHQMSRTEMEIHSAGPDRQLGTSDDIIQH